MAVKTMKKNTGSGQFTAGWHELTIKTAVDGKWTDKCREWISNKGIECLVYLDLDKTEEFGTDQYRTATNNWSIK